MEKDTSKIIVVTTLYNAEKYIPLCLQTLNQQSYNNFHCYITDDMSTDKSVELSKNIIGNDERFTIIENKEKLYQPGNYDQVIRNNDRINDNDIIVEVDGDDWLPTKNVLQRVYDLYTDKNVWIANGSFVYHDGRPGFSKKQTNLESLRTSVMTASHIRTWKAFLWRKILVDDLKDTDGKYWKISGDLSFMFPMLEMSGEEHYRFMPEINYVYNEENPINDHKVDIKSVVEVANKIRSKPKYSKL